MRLSATMRLTALCLSLVLFCACGPVYMPAQTPAPVAASHPQAVEVAVPVPQPVATVPTNPVPAVSAAAALVLDGVTGRILAAKNPDTQRAVASTQKLLTALVVTESGPLSDPVTIALSDTRVEPSKIYVRAGETYTRAALVKALLVKSGNDVAKALARDVAGSEDVFVAKMNSRARSLGMLNSHFKNPHGLTEEGQYSTARDLAMLAQEVYRSPALRNFMAVKAYDFSRPSGQTKLLENTNQLLSKIGYCTGMKTGTTRASGRCLISCGELNGRLAFVVVLGAKTESALFQDSENLLRWALERSPTASAAN